MATSKGKKPQVAKKIVNDIPEADPADKKSSARVWLLIGGGCVLLACFLVVLAAGAFFGYRYLTSGSEEIFYILYEDNYDDLIDLLVRMDSDGSDIEELINERDGFFMGTQAPYLGLNPFSPNGEMIVVRSGDWGEELILHHIDRNTSTYIREQTFPGGIFEGFSRDDKYFAFTAIDEDIEEITLIVINQDGDEVLAKRDLFFGAFSPTRDQIAAFEIDVRDEELRGIGLLNIQNEQYTELERLNIEVNEVNQLLTFFSPDGRTLYYRDHDELMSISTSGGRPRSVYRFDDPDIGLAFFPPNSDHAVILDSTNYDNYDMYSLDPRSDDLVKIDDDVFFDFLWGSDIWSQNYYQPTIVFSPDGEYVAYMVDKFDEFDVYVARLDNGERTRIVSSVYWIEFTFSPDGNQIAYIDFGEYEDGGDLYIIDIDGSNEVRLDRDVWSVQFVPNGRYLIYSVVSDPYSDRPESDVYRIKPDGDDRERIISGEDGIITLIWHPGD